MGRNEGLIYASTLLQRTSSDKKLHQMVLDLHHSIFYVVLRSIPHTIGIIILVAGEVYPANSPYRKNQYRADSRERLGDVIETIPATIAGVEYHFWP